MIELNVHVTDGAGQPIPAAIITLYVLDKNWRECPMEPRIRQQANFYNGTGPFAAATNTQGPFQVYGSVMAAGFNPGYFPMQPWDGTATLTIPVALTPSFRKPLAELARLRGAIWTARLDLPYGPRPGQPDNILAMDYLEIFTAADQARMLAAYGPTSPRRYTTAPMGPIVDPGYHGQYPATDWRADLTPYLDAAEKAERAGVGIVHFLIPDDLQAQPVEILDQQLTPIFSTARAQSLMQRVCLAWEPGGRYGFNNDWWVARVQWMARVFPRALRLVHLPADQDAPTGQDDDQRGFTNGRCWANVARFLHGWLVQNAGYTDSASEVPTAEFLKNFTDQFNPNIRGSFYDRFKTGGPSGDWPTTSAWSDLPPALWPLVNGAPYEGLLALPAEYASYADYWRNFAERYAQLLGQAALDVGAYGAFDGC